MSNDEQHINLYSGNIHKKKKIYLILRTIKSIK